MSPAASAGGGRAGAAGTPKLALEGILGTGPARRRPGFALTPLADIMFQLLIFFMLSTSLAPYALLPMTDRAGSGTGDRPVPGATAARATEPAIWHLGRGVIRAGTEEISLADLPAALAALHDLPVEEILLFVTETARTQDLVEVMQEVRRAGVVRLRLLGR